MVNAHRLPGSGPVLYLGLHRNGAVDGFLYHSILPRATFLISKQLRSNPLGRLFFDGIEITRQTDGACDREINANAMRACRDLVRSGGEVFVFPEGTSSLGPRHLPFKSGAAHLLLDILESQCPVNVVPLAIIYESPSAFRSRVEIVVGKSVSTEITDSLSRLGRLRELKSRLGAALEEVGVNLDSDESQDMTERLAYLSTLGTNHSYYKVLKALERHIPARVRQEWQALRAELRKHCVLYHQGLALYPVGPILPYVLYLTVTAPIVGVALLGNSVPLLAGYLAGKRLADGRNVVALWRILVGVPSFVLWTGTLAAVAILTGQVSWFALHGLATLVGMKLYYRVKKLTVIVHNGLFCRSMEDRGLAFRATVLKEIQSERCAET